MDPVHWFKHQFKRVGFIAIALIMITAFVDFFATFFIFWELVKIRKDVTG